MSGLLLQAVCRVTRSTRFLRSERPLIGSQTEPGSLPLGFATIHLLPIVPLAPRRSLRLLQVALRRVGSTECVQRGRQRLRSDASRYELQHPSGSPRGWGSPLRECARCVRPARSASLPVEQGASASQACPSLHPRSARTETARDGTLASMP